MNDTFQFTTYDTIILFIIIVASVGILTAITLCISSYPFKRLVKIVFKYPVLDLHQFTTIINSAPFAEQGILRLS